MHNNTLPTQNDEIDLRELWATIVKRKLTIIAVTTITIMAAAIYAWNTTPVYRGEVLIEIGDVIINSDPDNNKPTIIQLIENTGDLVEIITQATTTDENKDGKITVESPKGSSKLIKISYENNDKQKITKKLEDTAIFILNRHKLKSDFFHHANAQVRPSAIVGTIRVDNQPIKPKKQLIVAVALISGLILGIFLAFFMEFIQDSKTRREE